MGWRDRLRPASFRGAAFHVAAHSADPAGRRVQVHEYPGRDKPYPEDLGLKTREFTIEAYVIGDDYMAARDALIAACAKAGPGELIHPYLGTLSVACNGCKLTERADEGRLARFSLSFVDAGDNSYPAVSADTGKAVDIASTDAISVIQDDFAGSFSVDGRPAFVSDAGAGLAQQASKEILSLLGPSGSAPNVSQAAQLSGQALTLVRTPRLLAGQVTGLTSGVAGELGSGRPAMRGMMGLSTFGSNLGTVPATTATRRQQAANQGAMVSLVRRTGLVEAARAVPGVDFANQQEAFDLRDQLGELLDIEMESASDPVYSGLSGVRTAMVKDVNARAPGLANLTQVKVRSTEPALVTSYRIYGDAGRAEEIVARNRVRHPGFVPGGEGLEVLTRV